METFSALLVLCAGNWPVTGEIPSQMPETRTFDVFFDLRLNKRLVNNRKAGDLRRHRAHNTPTKNSVDDLFDYELKHQGLNKMATVWQITFSNIF